MANLARPMKNHFAVRQALPVSSPGRSRKEAAPLPVSRPVALAGGTTGTLGAFSPGWGSGKAPVLVA